MMKLSYRTFQKVAEDNFNSLIRQFFLAYKKVFRFNKGLNKRLSKLGKQKQSKPFIRLDCESSPVGNRTQI